MAQIRNFHTEFRWRGIHSGQWIICDADLDRDEAVAGAAIVAAIGVASAALPPPANIVLPAIFGAHAGDITHNNGAKGLTVQVEATAAAVAQAVHLTYSPRL